MQSTTFKQLSSSLQAELEALLDKPTSAYESDYNDALGWWLLIFLSSLFGASVAIWSLATGSLSLSDYMARLSANPGYMVNALGIPGFFVSVAVGTWTLITAAHNRGRRGYAALDLTIAVLRGRKVKLLAYDAIASAEERIVGRRGKRFTVFELKLKDGSTETLYVSGGWAKVVEAKLGQASWRPRRR